MTALSSPLPEPRTPESLFRDHLREMQKYARELEAVLGEQSPIVTRIRSCARSNTVALDRIAKGPCGECGK